MSKKKNTGRSQDKVSRRRFLKTSAVVAAGAAVGSFGVPQLIRPAAAAERGYILVGRCNPSTGTLAAFGEPSPWADQAALDAINKDGGIFIKKLGKKLPVKMKLLDTESDPTKAGELAARLILNDKIDVMIALHTPNTVNPVTAVCERFETPCISLDAPLEPWLPGGPYKWTYHAFWSVAQDFYPVCKGMWPQVPTNKVVGLVANNDPDGIGFGTVFKAQLAKDGYKIIDPGVFPYGTQDFSSMINIWKKNKVEILFGNVITPDFVTCWRQCQQMGFKPKIVTIARAILFPAAVEALGEDLAQGLSSEVWWSPHHPFKSSLTGQSAKDLCDAWTAQTKKQWSQPIGFKHAAYEILADALKRAQSLDKEAVRNAIDATRLNTIVGPVKYNKEHYSRTPLVGGQWVKGDKFPWKLNLVYNKEHTNIPLTGKMLPMP
ncbi:MAG: ABC transporter substrate-binding protein [Desulfarculaceae bacterium]|jgi:branched-chain amino acid transport system substrate-binding protein